MSTYIRLKVFFSPFRWYPIEGFSGIKNTEYNTKNAFKMINSFLAQFTINSRQQQKHNFAVLNSVTFPITVPVEASPKYTRKSIFFLNFLQTHRLVFPTRVLFAAYCKPYTKLDFIFVVFGFDKINIIYAFLDIGRSFNGFYIRV